MRVNYQNYAITKFRGYYRGIGQSWINTVRKLQDISVEPYLLRLNRDQGDADIGTEIRMKFGINAGVIDGYMNHVDECVLEEQIPYYFPVDWFIKEGIVHSWDNFPMKTQFPQIVTVHDTFLFSRKYRKYRNKWEFPPASMEGRWKHVDYVVCPSEFSKRDFLEEFDFPEGNVRVIPWGSKYEGILCGMQDDQKYFLYVSSPEKRKNFSLAVEAYRSFRKHYSDEYRMVVVADPNILNPMDRIEYEDLVSSTPGVSAIHHASEEQLCELYRGASALLMTSDLEGFGMPVVEAASLGCPVVMLNSSSLSEFGHVGCMVSSTSPETWAFHMSESVRTRSAGYDALKSLCREKFSYTRAAVEYNKLYESLS